MIPRDSHNGPIVYEGVIRIVAHALQLLPIGFAQ